MKKCKIIPVIFMLMLAMATPARAGIPTTCVNCSNFIQQILDSVTFAHELATQIQQYKEMMTHTANQVWMIEKETKRLLTLQQADLQQFTDQFVQLANAYRDLDMYTGDMSAITDIFRQIYPDLNHSYGLTENSSPNAVQEEWKERQKATDDAVEKLFGVAKNELDRLTKNPEQLKNHIASLLSKENETQIAQSANKLSSLMLLEMRDLNMMTAANMEFVSHVTQNKQTQKEIDKGKWDRATRVDDQQFKYEGNVRF